MASRSATAPEFCWTDTSSLALRAKEGSARPKKISDHVSIIRFIIEPFRLQNKQQCMRGLAIVVMRLSIEPRPSQYYDPNGGIPVRLLRYQHLQRLLGLAAV